MAGNSGSRVGNGHKDVAFGMPGRGSVGYMRGMMGVHMIGPGRPQMDPMMMADGMQPGPLTSGPGRGHASRGGGGGGYRGLGPMHGGMGGFKRQRSEGYVSEEPRGFAKRGNHGTQSDVFNSISEAVTPQMILYLWADQGQVWTPQQLAHALFSFAKLVEETCPDELQQV